jgi:2-desacetyl-2-hydroxyethyl bacteriochlorophyllide A dehydrogenase
MSTSRAVYIDEPERIRVATTEPRRPQPGEALVRVAGAGICGSDRELLAGGRPAGYVRYPVVPGHEWSGTVDAVGDPADGALVGKPVVGEGFRSCGRCDACRRGDNNLCAAPYDETGFTQPGAWADYLTLPARLLHVLPDGTDLRAAAALEPAACVAAACLQVAPVPGERVAVVGAGTLGLLAIQLLRASGPAELAVVVRRPSRAELALRCGATTVLSVDEAARSNRFDVVVEAAGTSGAARTSVQLARRGGRVALTGIPSVDEQPPSPTDLVVNQITVHTVFGAPSRAWSHAVRAFVSGALDPAMLITHEVPLDDVTEAFRLLADPAAGAVKVLLRP